MSALSDGTSAKAEQITAELVRCRHRGLEKLDLDDQRQRPVVAPELEGLASRYARKLRAVPAGRAAQIKTLLFDALQDFDASGSAEDAALIRGLLFSDSTPAVRKSAGALLRASRKSFGEPSETLFRERFKIAFGAFAKFLAHFVNSAAGAPDNALAETDRTGDFGANPLELATGHIDSRPTRFVDLLADAVEATIIGFDNELLVTALATALELKRARQNHQDAFWDSLDIIFLSESMLDFLDDHAVSPDRRVTVRERRRSMTKARRAVRLLLRKTDSTAWTVADSPFLPPFSGSLFVMSGPAGRRHVVQLIIRQPAPRTRTADHLYVEFDDLPSEFFTKAFRRVVDRSISDNRPVPVGNPSGRTFVCTETVYRAEVLQERSRSQNWLPMVLIVTTQRKRGEVAPILQLRTEVNAIREIDMISHLSRHIYQDEPSPLPGARTISAPPSFDISSECAKRAAQLRVQIEAGDDRPPELQELATGGYVNPDTDNLFFFVYSLEVPEGTTFPRESEMLRFTLPELLKARAHQALIIASELFKMTDRPGQFWKTALELATLNLALHHDHCGDLGQRLAHLANCSPDELVGVLAEVESLIKSTSPTCASSGREMKISGLSGWQYREFFYVLLPQYAKVGVPGAKEELRRISGEPVKPLLRRLASLYQDEDLLRAMPIEL